MGARHMGTVAMTVVMLLASTPVARAQLDKLKNTTPAERATALTAMMADKLDLTPEQKGKVGELNLKYANQMQPILTGSEGPFMKMRQARGIQAQKEAELKQLLSPAQFEKYVAAKDQMREQFEQRIADQKNGAGS